MLLTVFVAGIVGLVGAYAVGLMLDLPILPRNDIRLVISWESYEKAMNSGCLLFQNIGGGIPEFIRLTYWKNASEYAKFWYPEQKCAMIKLDWEMVKNYGFELIVYKEEPRLIKDPMSMLLIDVVSEASEID